MARKPKPLSNFDRIQSLASVRACIETKKLLLHDLRNTASHDLTDPNGPYLRQRQVILYRIECANAELAALDERYLNVPAAIAKAEAELAELNEKLIIAQHIKELQELEKLAERMRNVMPN